MNTKFYIFNENRIFERLEMSKFSESIAEQSDFNFKKFYKEDIDPKSTIFMMLTTPELKFVIYEHGYIMKIEGDIENSIILLKEIDKFIEEKKVYYLSPSQAVQNKSEQQYPRGAELAEIACFLDKLFNNNDYSSVINRSN